MVKSRLRWLGLLALAAYAVFLARNTAVVAGGSDSSGYLNSARLFAEGKFLICRGLNIGKGSESRVMLIKVI